MRLAGLKLESSSSVFLLILSQSVDLTCKNSVKYMRPIELRPLALQYKKLTGRKWVQGASGETGLATCAWQWESPRLCHSRKAPTRHVATGSAMIRRRVSCLGLLTNCDRHAVQDLNQVSRLQVTTPSQPESVPKPPISQVCLCGADVLQIFRALVATAAGSRVRATTPTF